MTTTQEEEEDYEEEKMSMKDLPFFLDCCEACNNFLENDVFGIKILDDEQVMFCRSIIQIFTRSLEIMNDSLLDEYYHAGGGMIAESIKEMCDCLVDKIDPFLAFFGHAIYDVWKDRDVEAFMKKMEYFDDCAVVLNMHVHFLKNPQDCDLVVLGVKKNSNWISWKKTCSSSKDKSKKKKSNKKKKKNDNSKEKMPMRSPINVAWC